VVRDSPDCPTWVMDMGGSHMRKDGRRSWMSYDFFVDTMIPFTFVFDCVESESAFWRPCGDYLRQQTHGFAGVRKG